jgi:hypothetical protein
VVRCRMPFAFPAGLPLRPFLNGRPRRCIPAAFAASSVTRVPPRRPRRHDTEPSRPRSPQAPLPAFARNPPRSRPHGWRATVAAPPWRAQRRRAPRLRALPRSRPPGRRTKLRHDLRANDRPKVMLQETHSLSVFAIGNGRRAVTPRRRPRATRPALSRGRLRSL